MANSDTTLAAAALAIAVFALISSLAQIIGQFLATADGLRRCQPSVMAGWAQRTRLRWRWSQFRYEVIFTTPAISIHPIRRPNSVGTKKVHGSRVPHKVAASKKKLSILGSDESYTNTLISRTLAPDMRHELACWISFLQAVHIKSESMVAQMPQKEILSRTDNEGVLAGFPAVAFRERSWDFMTPEVVRPFASITISDAAVLARRLGMEWMEFKPSEGIMKAEGGDHIISSLAIRGVGTVMQYNFIGDDTSPEEKTGPGREALASRELYPWTTEADGLGFGIIPGISEFSVPKFNIGTEEEILETMSELDRSGRATDYLRSLMKVYPGWTAGFADLIPMATPILRVRGTVLAHVPAPSEYFMGSTIHRPGFLVFHLNLKSGLERGGWTSQQRLLVLHRFEHLQYKYGALWEDEEESEKRGRGRSVEFLDDVQDCFDTTTDYFMRLTDGKDGVPRLRYYDLVKCHIKHNVSFFDEAVGRCGNGQSREHFGYPVGWVAEGAHVYWDNLREIVQDMKLLGCEDEDLVKDAWITLMFRAFCWHRCHFIVPGSRVPSRYYGSRQPVYIG